MRCEQRINRESQVVGNHRSWDTDLMTESPEPNFVVYSISGFSGECAVVVVMYTKWA